MKWIQELREGDNISEIYLCKKKQSLVTKAGKAYESLTLQDKTGTLDAKIWEPDSMGIDDFSELDYIEATGNITSFQGHLQFNIRRVRRCRDGECDPADYLPVSGKSVNNMYARLLAIVDSIREPSMKRLLEMFFKEDQDFIKAFRKSSAAKAVHHGFVGGLLEHTLGVAELCNYYCSAYPILKRDLLVPAALLHDIGKTKELSLFPKNDYTDDGQLIGHIVLGVEMIDDKLRQIPDFPPALSSQLRHCILAHHGELEYGSPKKPAIIEAAALYFADNTDSKFEIFKETFDNALPQEAWIGYQQFLGSNIRRTLF